ncbi:hypothetical protein [Bradyrhizobium hipponense]|uniref:hypothetical protein n=1 Tax=Bradyrhizobium hipponense TaxID=2605638 RepID=UPI001652B9E8|nr:hypothetical protein [Bradyrhizobium hipponense]
MSVHEIADAECASSDHSSRAPALCPPVAYQAPTAIKATMVRHETQAIVAVYNSGVFIVASRAVAAWLVTAASRRALCLVAASIRRLVTDLVLFVHPINPTLIGSVGIAIRLWDFRTLTRDQKLFPHFSETGTAVFSIKQVEYGGHRCPRRLNMTVEVPPRIFG